jgi:Fur family transcriptional regulator, ferric uptake regulator
MDVVQTRILDSRASAVLRRKHLNITDSRKKILSLFLNHKDALAHADIEKNAGEKFDRVTVYRTLQTFVEKGIVHTIPTADNAILYALCKDCDEEHHHDDHVHFVCQDCNTTICLDDVVSPKIKLPDGYMPENVQVVINGVCKNCTAKNN